MRDTRTSGEKFHAASRLESCLGEEDHAVAVGAAGHQVRGGGEKDNVVTIAADGWVPADIAGLGFWIRRVGHRDADGARSAAGPHTVARVTNEDVFESTGGKCIARHKVCGYRVES